MYLLQAPSRTNTKWGLGALGAFRRRAGLDLMGMGRVSSATTIRAIAAGRVMPSRRRRGLRGLGQDDDPYGGTLDTVGSSAPVVNENYNDPDYAIIAAQSNAANTPLVAVPGAAPITTLSPAPASQMPYSSLVSPTGLQPTTYISSSGVPYTGTSLPFTMATNPALGINNGSLLLGLGAIGLLAVFSSGGGGSRRRNGRRRR